tara:strand:+ start:10492 stop:11310 length:819 start_codon:yes stop_codon:yes gene_type:complete
MDKDAEIARLKKMLEDQEMSAKMLVRRDLELTRAHEKLEELGRLKSDFVSVVAHQLRTPLSVTKWALDMLWDTNRQSMSTEQAQVLARGRESNERMITLVDDLLRVDLHEGGKIQYSFDEMYLQDVVKAVAHQLEAIAVQRDVTMVVELEKTAPKVKGDADKLGSAVQNLIENALKYTPQNGSVTVSLYRDGAQVIVSVKDTGIGVPKSEHEKIFSRFYRGENAIRTVTEGSGLGLFIAQKIVRRHGGKIWFESEEGEGATFFFSIPVNNNV